jgi:hypothetical protein
MLQVWRRSLRKSLGRLVALPHVVEPRVETPPAVALHERGCLRTDRSLAVVGVRAASELQVVQENTRFRFSMKYATHAAKSRGYIRTIPCDSAYNPLVKPVQTKRIMKYLDLVGNKCFISYSVILIKKGGFAFAAFA